MLRKKSRIAVAMSGGVDSSVAAALLVEQGYDVVGFFAKTWTPAPGDGTVCTWVAERRDALRVAAKLDIPLETVDLEEIYRQRVVDALFAGYGRGETPNPDVLCNREVKFDALLKAAQLLGAEKLATGHYARIEQVGDTAHLFRGRDKNKDQSYFLWAIKQPALPAILFPIGDLEKPAVRQLAKRFDLPVATKKDSQGICFLGPTDLPTFLQTRLPVRSGAILDAESGRVIGQHVGAQLYTLGQRHGFGQAAASASAGRFVIEISVADNTITVGGRELLFKRSVSVRELNWLDLAFGDILRQSGSLSIVAQIRYRQAPTTAQLFAVNNGYRLEFISPVFAPTPGQSVVFYHQEQLLGGGVIDQVLA